MIDEAAIEAALDRLRANRCHRGPGSMPGFTYVVLSPAVGFVKIGMTFDPERRLIDIQTMNADDLQIATLIHGAWAELVIHKAPAEYRCHGEWFALANPIPEPVDGVCYGCAINVKKGKRKQPVPYLQVNPVAKHRAA